MKVSKFSINLSIILPRNYSADKFKGSIELSTDNSQSELGAGSNFYVFDNDKFIYF